MTKLKNVTALVAVAVSVAGGLAWGGIEGSKHDFSNRAWSGGDQCAACHSPHREKPPLAAPLWNPKADLSRTFGMSISQTKTKSPGIGTLMCLRCHDGTIANDAVGGVSGGRFANKQHPGIFATAHGPSDHPVGVDYPQFDDGYHAQPTVLAKGTVLLPNAKVECVSCHDPHNISNIKHMLVTSNARSALCLTCHRK